MVEKRQYDKLIWVDATSPTPKEVRSLIDEYKLHHRAGEEMLAPSSRSKVEDYGDHLHLILHFPSFGKSARAGASQEVDFIIGKDFVITAHYDSVEPLRKFAKAFEVGTMLEREQSGAHAGHLLWHMLKGFYSTLLQELEHIENKIIDIEKRVFDDSERSVVGSISEVGRELLAFTQAIRLHQNVLISFEIIGGRIYGDGFLPNLREIISLHNRACEELEGNKELLSELRSTNDSLVSAKQNEIIRTLTAVSFAILPLTLISAIFTMDVPNKPFSNSPQGFLAVVILMLITLALTLGYFKVKKWF